MLMVLYLMYELGTISNTRVVGVAGSYLWQRQMCKSDPLYPHHGPVMAMSPDGETGETLSPPTHLRV